jgi:hypothetical protein
MIQQKSATPQIWMKDSAVLRKYEAQRKLKLKKVYTVVVDARSSRSNPGVYIRKGVGCMTLSSMEKVKGGMKGLRTAIK